jgi:hypothetical protein
VFVFPSEFIKGGLVNAIALFGGSGDQGLAMTMPRTSSQATLRGLHRGAEYRDVTDEISAPFRNAVSHHPEASMRRAMNV